MAAAAGAQCADIEVVRGRRGEGDEPPLVKHGHCESHVGPMAGAGIGVVVHDHIARGGTASPRARKVFKMPRM